MSVKGSDHVSSWKPSKARYEFRTNPDFKGVTTAGFCMGYLQANMTMLPSSLADDFEQFCALNAAACPVIYRSKIGEVSAGHLAPGSDIRYETGGDGNWQWGESGDGCEFRNGKRIPTRSQ